MMRKTAKKWETQFSLQHQIREKLMHELIKLCNLYFFIILLIDRAFMEQLSIYENIVITLK